MSIHNYSLIAAVLLSVRNMHFKFLTVQLQ